MPCLAPAFWPKALRLESRSLRHLERRRPQRPVAKHLQLVHRPMAQQAARAVGPGEVGEGAAWQFSPDKNAHRA